jgi:hypothetical protein
MQLGFYLICHKLMCMFSIVSQTYVCFRQITLKLLCQHQTDKKIFKYNNMLST